MKLASSTKIRMKLKNGNYRMERESRWASKIEFVRVGKGDNLISSGREVGEPRRRELT